LPALDPNNKLAQEQSQLVLGMLNILAQRLPLMYRYDRDELARSLALVDTLRDQTKHLPAAHDAMHALERCAKTGQDVLNRAKADLSELEAANFELREKVGALISTIYEGADMSQLSNVSKTITAHAKEQLLRERAWVILQGLEPDAKVVPAIETLI
jgi:signal transduction histidine kinase